MFSLFAFAQLCASNFNKQKMENRISINAVSPQAYKAMYALEAYLAKAEISKTLKELIKIRASQINNCAFCIDMHTRDALKNGETNQRIFLLSAWKEATRFFSQEEQTVLEVKQPIIRPHKSSAKCRSRRLSWPL
jgi:AhpD family alkylhydroperoxidase